MEFKMENNFLKQNFTMRFAQKEDAQTIFSFIKGIAEYEKMDNELECSKESIITTIFEQKQAEVILAEENGKAVGFALFFHNYSTFKGKHGLYLEDLFVLPEKRGIGYGKALFLELISLAKKRDCGRMEWSCLNWNTPSIEFYKNMGAVSMDEWKTYRLNEEQLNSLGSNL